MDSGYIITGRTSSFGNGGYGVYVIRTKQNGDTLWTKVYGNVGWDSGLKIKQTADGGFVIHGARNLSGGPPFDMFLMKINNIGDMLWAKTYGGSNDEGGNFLSICVDGGYIIGGATQSFGVGGYDILLVKVDSAGNIQWAKTYGGTLDDGGINILQTSDGGYIVCGVTKSYGTGDNDAFLMKVDSNGNVQWAKKYDESVDYRMWGLVQNSNKEIVLAGDRGDLSTSNRDGCIIKTDSIGNVKWCKTYFGGSDIDLLFGLSLCQDYGFISAGISYSTITNYDVFIVKTDSAGDSGCNQTPVFPTVSAITFDTTDPVIPVTSGGIIAMGTYSIVKRGGKIDTLCFTNGIEEAIINKNDILIFPNPTTGKFEVNIEKSEVKSLEIYNIQGQIVKTIINNQSKTTNEIDISALPDGIYLLKIQSDKKSVIRKIIKIN
jgi:hypothetical protein